MYVGVSLGSTGDGALLIESVAAAKAAVSGVGDSIGFVDRNSGADDSLLALDLSDVGGAVVGESGLGGLLDLNVGHNGLTSGLSDDSLTVVSPGSRGLSSLKGAGVG